jgi:hypothetical protein
MVCSVRSRNRPTDLKEKMKQSRSRQVTACPREINSSKPSGYYVVTRRVDYRRGFGFDIGFSDHLYTPLMSTSNYSATIFTIHKSPQHTLSLLQPAVSSPAVPWQRLLIVEIFQLHMLKSSLHKLPYRTDLVAPIFFLTTLRHGPCRNTSFPTVTLLLRTYSLQRERVCRAVAQKWVLSTESSLSNGSIRHRL